MSTALLTNVFNIGLRKACNTLLILLLLFFKLQAQNCPPGSSFSLSDSTCGQILPGVTVSCGSIAFCVSDSIGITTTSALPFDSVFVCWGDGFTDTVVGNISSCLYHKYNFRSDTCLSNGSNFLNPTVTIFYIKHCALGYSSNTFNTYPKVKFLPNSRFQVPDTICQDAPLPITILGCANADMLDTTFITWDMGDGNVFNLYSTNSNVTVPAPAFQYLVPGTYTITLTQSNSCGTTSTSQTMHIKAKPILNPVLTNYSGCTPDTLGVIVNSQHTNGYAWLWQVNPGGVTISNPNDSQPSFIALNTNTYGFQVQVGDNICCSPFFSGNWCLWNDSVSFLQGPSALYTPIADTCVSWPVNYSINLSNNVSFSPFNLDSSWALTCNGNAVLISNTGQVQITDTGHYQLMINVSNTCDTLIYAYSFIVSTPPPNPNIKTDSTVCVNALPVDLNTISNNIFGYWAWNGNVLQPAFFNPSTATTAANNLIFTTGPAGCDVTDTIVINVVGIGITAGADYDVCSNSDTINISGGAIPNTGIWQGNGIISSSGTFNPDSTLVNPAVVTYTINTGGCTIIDTLLVNLSTPPAAAFNIPTCICVNTPALFEDTIANTIATWDFGDLTPPVSSNNTSHIYTLPGSYTVTLIIQNTLAPFCVDTIKKNVFVVNAASAVFNVSKDTACSAIAITTNFISAVDTNFTYVWNYGDGTLDSSYTPAPHLYATDTIIKTYYIQATVNSCCGSVTYTDSVVISPSPDAGFALINTTGCSPDTVYYYDFSAGLPDQFSLYINGQLSNVQPYYILTTDSADSIYTFMLIANNECGTDTMVVNDTIHPGTMKALFNTSDETVCIGTPVNFVSVTSLLVPSAAISWDFGDGNYASNDTVTHIYQQPGVYTVWMHAYQCGIDSISKTITVLPPPTDTFTVAPVHCVNSVVQFNNLSNGAGFSWNFGDGSLPDSTVNAQHVYVSSGVYQVSLIANSLAGCRDTFTINITIVPTPIATVHVPVNQVCLGKPITVNANGSANVFFSFDMGDGVTINNQPPFNYLYNDTGMYAVTLTVTDANNCTFDTTFNSVFIRPIAKADFSYAQVPPCTMPAQIHFTNSSILASSYNWYFGVSDSTQQTNPIRTFNTDTSFTATLIANNLYGCQSTYSDIVNVYAAPVSLFSASDTLICPGDIISFMHNSSSNANSFNWSFGNGVTSTLATPDPQLYASTGSYSVSLITGNDSICFDTLYLANYITVQSQPQAQFTYQSIDTVVNQITFTPSGYYQFNDLSLNTSTVLWDFDDGTSSVFHNPLHLYYSSGEKCVMLIAKNNNECTDTAVTCFIVDLPGTLYLPNSVSPDEGNEEERSFFAKGTSIKNYKLEIFSPFGELLWFCEEGNFENGLSKCRWAGTDLQGKTLPQGAYVWKVTGSFENGTKLTDMSEKGKLRTAGTVMLIR